MPNLPAASLACDLAKFVDSPVLSDVELRLDDGTRLHAHKIVLVARSRYFEALLTGPMIESREALVPVTGVDHTTMRAVLEYLYTDNINHADTQQLLDLLCAADRFCLERLSALVEHSLVAAIDAHNATTLLYVADRFHAFGLKSACLRFILTCPEYIEGGDLPEPLAEQVRQTQRLKRRQ